MALIDQLRLLDRALRDPGVRAGLKKTRSRDAAVLAACDQARFDAVALRQSEMIRDRWWRARFPGTLAGAAHASGGTTADVARAALASEHYDRRQGEDETGRVLLGWLVEQDLPAWLLEVAAYEYVIGVGLPRRARGLGVDLALERELLPEGSHFFEASPSRGKVALATRAAVLPLELRAGELRVALASGRAPSRKLLAAPATSPLVFAVEGEEALELELPPIAVDLVSLVAAPIDEKALVAGFAPEDRREVRAGLALLVKLGVVSRGPRKAK
jgi:hypothetical protein